MREEELLEYIEKNKTNHIEYEEIIGSKTFMPYSQWCKEQGKKWREFENSATKIVKK